MTTEDRNKLLTILREGRETWLDSLAGATNITQRPAPDRWSVLEVAEHVAMVEKRLAHLIRNAPHDASTPSPDQGREDAFAATIAARAERFQAPEFVQPAGAMKSLDEAIAAFEEARTGAIEFVESNPDLRATTTKHVRFGVVSGYEMAVIMASHPVRHAAQVAEVRETVES